MAKKIVENQQLMSAARAAINDNFTELYEQAASSGGSSTFAALTDTPTELTADKYLKVNTEGTALELVDAPVGSGSATLSGGGIGLSSYAQEISNFDGTLPDYIVNGYQIGQLYSVSPTLIYYLINPIDDQYIGFNNDSTGTRSTYSFPSVNFNPVLGSLQEYVDSPDRAIYVGGSSSGGTLSGGGIGSLDYIKNLYATGDVRLRFTETLPDAIVAKDGDGAGDYWDQVET